MRGGEVRLGGRESWRFSEKGGGRNLRSSREGFFLHPEKGLKEKERASSIAAKKRRKKKKKGPHVGQGTKRDRL